MGKKIIITIIIIILLIFFSVIFSLINMTNDKIMSNIKINGIDVSNITRQEAIEKLNKYVEGKKKIIAKYQDYQVEILGEQINATYNTEQAIQEAYKIGREGNIITNNYKILWCMLKGKDLNYTFQINDELLEKEVQTISQNLPNQMIESSYYIEGNELIIQKGKEGIIAKKQELKDIIYNTIQDNVENEEIQIPVENAKPSEINIEEIHKQIYKEPQNAYIEKDPIKVYPHINGVDFAVSIEEVKQILNEEKTEYIIPLKITEPEITTNNLGQDAFPDLLGRYTTRYDPGLTDRNTNLQLATQKINNQIIMPEEIFSYNQVVGQRTIEKGYKEAAAYAGGEVVQDVGGGICQISSTLYNTVLLANLEIVERSNHHFATSYVSSGLDATVSWGTIDFKFKNTRKYPIKIIANIKNGVVDISIYGIREEVEYEIIMQTKIVETIPREIKYKVDKTLKEGEELVEKEGVDGEIIETYRIVKQGNNVISKDLISKDTYAPMNKIIKKKN